MGKFKVDENMPAEAAAMLTQIGHDALTVPDQQMGGRADPDVAAVCRQEVEQIPLRSARTSPIFAYPPADYPGIIVLRLSRLDKHRVLAHVQPCCRPWIKNHWLASYGLWTRQRFASVDLSDGCFAIQRLQVDCGWT